MNGLLITFEGIEGAGKSTQIEKLSQALKHQGFNPLITREPGGTPIGERIRDLILDKRHQMMAPKTELFLYLSSRAQHIAEVIEPSLDKGKIVITDRFSDATLAYQGYGRGEELGRLKELNRYILNAREPHITFLLDIDVSVGLSRIGKRGPLNRLDLEKFDFHKRVREGYLKIAKENPHRIHVLQGATDPETIHKEITQKLSPFIEIHQSSKKKVKLNTQKR